MLEMTINKVVCLSKNKGTARWTCLTSLLDVIKAVVERIDKPNIDWPMNQSLFILNSYKLYSNIVFLFYK